MKRHWFSILTASLLVCVMARGSAGSPSNPEIGKEQAIAIAKRVVIQLGWKEVEVVSASLDSGHWQVVLWCLPKTPGGFGTVEISTEGRVIRFIPGK